MEKGRIEEAGKVFKQIAKWNNVTNWDTSLNDQVIDILEDTERDRKAVSRSKRFLTYWHLFNSKQSTMIIFVICVVKAVTVGLYYGLLFDMGKLAGDISLNLVLTMIIRGVINCLPFFIDKFTHIGRKPMIVGSLIMCSLCMGYFLLAYLTSLSTIAPVTINIAAYLGIGFLSIVGAVIQGTSLIELTPTLLRNMGGAFVTAVSRIGAVLGPQILLLSRFWKPTPSLIFFVEMVVATILTILILPETKGKPLPDLPPHLLASKKATKQTILNDNMKLTIKNIESKV